MEADLLRYYSIDLMDLWRGGLSFRRLWVLIKHLPSESWTQTKLRDEREREHELVEPADGPQTFGPWSLENYQLAQLADGLNHLRYVLAKVNGQENYPEPTPTPRPGLNRRVRRQTAAGVAYLKRLRGRE